jgi:hypothetical protein
MRHGSYIIVLLCLFLASPPQQSNAASAADGRNQALCDIFSNRILNQNSAAVRHQAAARPRTQRFELLKRWVLPHAGRPHFRLNGNFSQLSPAPPAADYSSDDIARIEQAQQSGHSRILVGGTLLSPAFDLVDIAHEIDQLDELRQLLLTEPPIAGFADGPPSEQMHRDSPAFRYDNRARLAMLALVELKAENFVDANEHLLQLCNIASTVPIRDPDNRWPEMLAFWRGAHHRQSCDVVSIAIYEMVFRDLHQGSGTGSDVWDRHLFALMGFKRLFTDPQATTNDFYTGLSTGQWAGASFDMASLRGQGMPAARWIIRDRQIEHLCGQENDHVYFQSPLQGDFDVDCLSTTFDYRNVQTFIAGRWAGPAWGMKNFELGDHRRSFRMPTLGPKMSEDVGDYFRTRLNSKDGIATIYANGRPMFSTPVTDNTDPWIGGRFWHRYHGGISDVRITGTPTIPATLNLAYDRTLTGWADYYSTRNLDSLRNWSFSNNEILAAASETETERLLRYHRPMLEDGEIEYEFFYASNPQSELQSHVHPAIDRCAFILKPDGVQIHWCTDAIYDHTSLPFDNEFTEAHNRRGPATLPLIEAAWNRVKLKWQGDLVDVILNDRLVYQRTLEVTNMRRFGFFYNPQRSSARIRNVRWTGDWPRQLPPLADQDLADNAAVAHLDTTASQFRTLAFDLQSLQQLPKELELFGDGTDPVISSEHSAAGLTVREHSPASTEWNAAVIAFQGQLSGDFDITLQYSDFRSEVAPPNKFPGVSIHINPQTQPTWQIENMVRHVAPDIYTFASQLESPRPDGTSRWDVESFPADATEGQLRIARRGTTVWFLFAPIDSSQFRIFHSAPFTADDIPPGTLQLRLVSDGLDTATQVTFRKWTVSAQQIDFPENN